METLRRQICMDDLRSHVNGLVPFCAFNGTSDIINVDAGIYNGNFEQYVCDFAFIDASGVTIDGIPSVEETEVSRMVYLETLTKYYFVQNLIKNGILIEKAADNYLEISGETCDYSITFENDGSYTWNKSDEEVGKYEIIPVDEDAFRVDYETGKYFFNEEYTDFSGIVENYDKVLLISSYDKYAQYEQEWEDWWQSGFERTDSSASTWETAYLDENYVEPPFFKFCQDFETYFLGLVNVPEVFNGQPISGGKVPEVVFFLNFTDYLQWFKENEYKVSNDISLKEEWDRRGGDNFYAFLKTIVPIWKTRYVPTLEDGDCESYFTFVPPYLNMPLFFQGTFKEERTFSPYEYSIEETDYGTTKVNAIEPYAAPTSGVGSALTPHFVEFLKWEEVAYANNDFLDGEDIHDYYYSIDEDNRREVIDESGNTHLQILFDDEWTEIGVVLDFAAFLEYDSTYESYKESEVDGDNVIHYFLARVEDCGQMETKLPTLYSDDAIYLADNIFGVFEDFEDDSGNTIGQLFKCTYHTASSLTPQIVVHFSGYSYDYRIIDHQDEQGNYMKEYVPHKTVNRDNEYTEIVETAPTVTTDCYQVVDVRVIGGGNPVVVVAESAETTYNSYGMKDTEYLYWSAVTTYIYGWWECEKVEFDPSTTRCADGEYVAAGDDSKYRSIMTLSNLVNYVNEKEDGDVYYFMATFDNGVVSSDDPAEFQWKAGETEITRVNNPSDEMTRKFKLPYEVNVPRNVITFGEGDEAVIAYDVVTDMTYNEDTMCMEISYVIGATSGANIDETGIHCVEIIPYSLEKEMLPVDGVHLAEIYYEKLDYEKETETVSNVEFKLGREARMAMITGMEVATQWDGKSAINAYLITRDGINELMDGMRYEIDAIYDRGNAAAWEKHFKLSECNTMEDLENYSNNIFNI